MVVTIIVVLFMVVIVVIVALVIVTFIATMVVVMIGIVRRRCGRIVSTAAGEKHGCCEHCGQK